MLLLLLDVVFKKMMKMLYNFQKNTKIENKMDDKKIRNNDKRFINNNGE